MDIQILGSVALVAGDRRIALASRRVRTVLALLALSPGAPVPFDHLVDELWADRSIGNARNALQAHILRLRKLLEMVTGEPGDQIVRTVGGGYQLAVPPESIDAQRFLSLAERGSGHVTREPGEAIKLLDEALQLWRGPALFDVCDGLRCRMEAAQLDERRLSAREDLVTAKLANGEERRVVGELKRLTAEHPERERFSEQLMLALYRDGRQAEALDVFHHARKRLASELGLEPGRSLQQLYQAILVQDRMLS